MIRTTLIAALVLGSVSAPGMLFSSAAAQDAAYDAQRPAPLSRQELDSILAPVALYPDQVLSQVLMAATYPLEVVEAARWVDRPENAPLRGERLSDALLDQDWDLSVKALAPFPQVLQMMNADLKWLARVGDAFVFQEGEVMDAVQQLRREANASGRLRSDSRQRVIVQDGEIIIEPVDPDMVYVAVYDPAEVYAPWPYPDYPPVYIPPPVDYAFAPGVRYYSYAVVPSLWGWQSWDWRFRRIHFIDSYKYRYHNRGRDFGNDRWRHDPRHRRGIGYGNGFRGPINTGGPRVDRPRPPEARIPDGYNPRIRAPRPEGVTPDFSRDDGRRPGGYRNRQPVPQVATPPVQAQAPPVAQTPTVRTPPQESARRNRVMELRETDPPAARRGRPPRPDRGPPAPDPNDPATLARQSRQLQQNGSITAPPLTNMPPQTQQRFRQDTSITAPPLTNMQPRAANPPPVATEPAPSNDPGYSRRGGGNRDAPPVEASRNPANCRARGGNC